MIKLEDKEKRNNRNSNKIKEINKKNKIISKKEKQIKLIFSRNILYFYLL